MITALALTAALVLGYLLGRIRPYDRLDTWVWRRLFFGGKWTRSRPQQVLTLAVHALVRPAATVWIWRHRNDSPPGRSPAVEVPVFDPERKNKREHNEPEVP